MKNIHSVILFVCMVSPFSSYAMQIEADPSDQHHQSNSSARRSQDPDEMLRHFKQATPPAELQRLQALAKQILADAKKQEEERIAAAVSRIVAH